MRDAFNYIYNQLSAEDKKHYSTFIPLYGRWKDIFELAEQDFDSFKDYICGYFIPDIHGDWGLFCKWFPRK